MVQATVALLAFLGVTATAGGVAMLAGVAPPDEWLDAVPLIQTWWLPGVVLAAGFGAGSLITAYGVAHRPRWRLLGPVERLTGQHWSWSATILLGLGQVVWIALELAYLPQVSFLQPCYALVGLALLLLPMHPRVRAHLTEDDATGEVRKMRRLLVLGAGTAGTMVVNKLRRRLGRADWQITVVEASDRHFYQPGLLFLPFGRYAPRQVSKPTRPLIGDGVELVRGEVHRVDPASNRVLLSDGRSLPYDYLVIATGVSPRPDQTPGMLDGGEWHKRIFDFYTYDGAVALAQALDRFEGGRLVVHITDMPIKCPVAPLEFAFLADDFFRRGGTRDLVELVYVTPLPGAFTKPVAAARLGSMLDERKIAVEPDFLVERIDGTTLVSYDQREIPFDLLVTVPLNMGADFVARSGLGDELNLVPVDRHTFLSTAYDNIFAVGDANDIPTSKAGSVAHFSVDVFADNFVAYAAGRPMTGRFDGHANCFVESGDGKALMIDFDYHTEPLPGTYPLPGAGPFRLLSESAVNHWGKLAFRWMYWHLLLPGRLPALRK